MAIQQEAKGSKSETTWEPGVLGTIEGALTDAFHWVTENPVPVVAALLGAVVVGIASAVVYEYGESKAGGASAALAEIERDYVRVLEENRDATTAVEPANPEMAEAAKQAADLAQKEIDEARVAALAAIDELAEEFAGTLGASMAQIRGASLEIEAEDLAAADARLARAIEADPGTAALPGLLRMRGYVLDELDRPSEAGEAYERAGAVPDYPARSDCFVQAGEAFERAGEIARAIGAYEAAITVADDAPGMETQIEARLRALRRRAANPIVE